MREEIQLVWKFKHGNEEALCRIYEKYKKDMLGLAVAISNNKNVAEDAVHDVFVSFAESVDRIELKSNLRSYLLACVANHLRNLQRVKPRQMISEEVVERLSSQSDRPDNVVMAEEISQTIKNAIAHLPYEQKEVVIMHLQSELKFKEIAKAQGVSVSTVQSRYLYGLRKLRSLLNSEIEK
jgi:RNA polymerase sigma-70 factor (ECF subfamily)